MSIFITSQLVSDTVTVQISNNFHSRHDHHIWWSHLHSDSLPSNNLISENNSLLVVEEIKSLCCNVILVGTEKDVNIWDAWCNVTGNLVIRNASDLVNTTCPDFSVLYRHLNNALASKSCTSSSDQWYSQPSMKCLDHETWDYSKLSLVTNIQNHQHPPALIHLISGDESEILNIFYQPSTLVSTD